MMFSPPVKYFNPEESETSVKVPLVLFPIAHTSFQSPAAGDDIQVAIIVKVVNNTATGHIVGIETCRHRGIYKGLYAAGRICIKSL